MLFVLAIFSTLAGLGASLMTAVFLLACSPNSSPSQLREIKALMLGVAVVGVAGAAGAVWGMVRSRFGLAAAAGGGRRAGGGVWRAAGVALCDAAIAGGDGPHRRAGDFRGVGLVLPPAARLAAKLV